MKKIMKNNIKLVIGMIIGIVCSSMTVSAAYKYIASEFAYTAPNVSNIEEALNNLHNGNLNTELERLDIEPVFVGSGNASYFPNHTPTKTLIPATLEQEGYLSLENNIFTVQKAGYYIIFSAAGSNRGGEGNNYDGAYISIHINGKEKDSTGESNDAYKTTYTLEKLNIGDTISGYYYGDGGITAKRSEYKIIYIG